MSDEVNPYAAPQAETLMNPAYTTSPVDTYRVEGKLVAVTQDVQLPHLCIKTGEECGERDRKRKVLYWASPWWVLLIFVPFCGLLGYAIVYLCVRKKVTVQFSIAPKPRRNLILRQVVCLLLVFGAVGLTLYGFINEEPALGFGGILLLLVGLVVTSVVSTQLRVRKRKEGWFYLAGTGKPFRSAITPPAL